MVVWGLVMIIFRIFAELKYEGCPYHTIDN